jgi:hypothetical protein
MNAEPDQNQAWAFAVYQLRILLSEHVWRPVEDKNEGVYVAAQFVDALYKQAYEILAGQAVDVKKTMKAIAEFDQKHGQNFVKKLSELSRQSAEAAQYAQKIEKENKNKYRA